MDEHDDDIEATRMPPSAPEEHWWWLAVNGPSCAACFIPLPASRLSVSPTPEQLIGFPTREEQWAAQKLLLEAPMSKVRAFLDSLPPRIVAGEIAYIRPANPEPPTTGPTLWTSAPKESSDDSGSSRDSVG